MKTKTSIRTSGDQKLSPGSSPRKSSPRKPGFQCQICFAVSRTQSDYVKHILEAHSAPLATAESEEEVETLQENEVEEDQLSEEEVKYKEDENIKEEQVEEEKVEQEEDIQDEQVEEEEDVQADQIEGEDDDQEEEVEQEDVKEESSQTKARTVVEEYLEFSVNESSVPEKSIIPTTEKTVLKKSRNCQHCNKVFLTPAHLKLHIETNCGQDKKFACQYCGSQFLSKPILKTHLLIHTAERKFKCDDCEKSFLSAGQLKVHRRVHTKEQPFECTLCEKRFAYRESLVTHSVQHTGIKPYQCLCCKQEFSCVGNLIKHRNARSHTCGRPEYNQNTRVAPRATTKVANVQRAKRRVKRKKKEDDVLTQNRIIVVQEVVAHEEDDQVEVEAKSSTAKGFKLKPSEKSATGEFVANFNVEEEDGDEEDQQGAKDKFDNDEDDYDVMEIIPLDPIAEENQIAVEMDHLITEDIVMGSEEEEQVDDKHCVTYKIVSSREIDGILEIGKLRRKQKQKRATYRCGFCPKWYYDKDRKDVHEAVHGEHGDLLIKCALCPLHFRTDEMALAHQADKHGEQLECKVCGKTMLANAMPDHLMEEHTTQEKTRLKRQLACHKCQKEFSSVTGLQKHNQSGCGQKGSHRCEICKKSYASAGTLKVHMSCHTNEKPFQCSVCKKRLRTQMQLNVHERVHTGEKPYQCDQCGKAYAHRESLVTHQSTHTGFKRFMCIACGNRFSCISNLQSHRKARPDSCGKVPAYTKPVGLNEDVKHLKGWMGKGVL